MSIATRLNEAMQSGDGRGKLSQTELSVRSGVPQPTIARILKGNMKKGPETSTLVALSNALGVEFNWLQQGTLPKHPGGKAASTLPVVGVSDRPQEFKRHWLTQEEADHLADFRSLTPKGQKRLRAVVMGMKRDDVSSDTVDKL